MRALLYLRRSFRRRARRHLPLLVILTCAIILPLILSIYRDSLVHGQALYVWEKTRGHDYHLRGAKEEHLPHFEQINGVTASYADGTIYLDVAPGTQAESLDRMLAGIVLGIGDEGLTLVNMTQFGKDESNHRFANQLLLVCAVIMGISLLIIRSAYKTHLNQFAPEIGALRAIGAGRRQIILIFYAEFILLFLIAGAVAVASASLLMRLLFDRFLQIRDVQNLSWAVFHVNPVSVLAQLAAFFAALSLLIVLTLRKACKRPVVSLLREDESGDRIKRVKRGLAFRKTAAASLRRLLLRRANSRYVGCLLISLPITVAFLFLFNYVVINVDAVSTPPKYAIRVNSADLFARVDWVSEDEIEQISRMEGVEAVYPSYNPSTSLYWVRDARMEGPAALDFGDGRYATTQIYRHAEWYAENPDTPVCREPNGVAVSKNHKYLKYEIGDTILLQPSPFPPGGDGTAREMPPIELTVVELLDLEWTDRMVALYVGDELFETLMQGQPMNRLNIALSDPASHAEVEARVRALFAGRQVTILNDQASYEQTQVSVVGVLIMALCLFALMFAFVLVILFTKLSDYVDSQRARIRTLYQLGASRRDLCGAYMRQARVMALASLLPALALGFGLLLLFFRGTGYSIRVNATTVCAHLAVIALVAFAYTAPVYRALRGVLRGLTE